MKKFKNIKTGNVLRVKDEFTKPYEKSEQYIEIVAKPEQPEEPASKAKK